MKLPPADFVPVNHAVLVVPNTYKSTYAAGTVLVSTADIVRENTGIHAYICIYL